MNQITLFDQNRPLTMSSREIAELVSSRHVDICRSIERMMESGVIKRYAPTAYTHPQNGQPYKEYLLEKRDTFVVVAQNCPVFTAKIVDRWQELESAIQSKAFAALPDFTKPAVAARAWADQVEARERAEYQAAELASENAKLLPRAKVAESIADAIGLHSVAAAAKILGTGQKRLFDWLRKREILNGHNVPYQEYLEGGYFKLKESTYRAGDVDHIYPQTFVTGKGMVWLAKKHIGEAQEIIFQ